MTASVAPGRAEEVRLQNDGRPSFGEGWGEPVAWEEYEAFQINVGESQSVEQTAFLFDYGEDTVTIDFRNEDFKTIDGPLQGNIADPQAVDDPQASISWAQRNLHFRYRLWVPGQEAPAGVIFTPYLIRAARTGDNIVVKLTDEAVSERDIADAY
jgi:hypothetical protein